MGDDLLDPRVIDLARADEREQRADARVGLAPDVLAGPRPEGVVERRLIGVDEEVDGLVLGHAQPPGRVLDRRPRRCAGRARRTRRRPRTSGRARCRRPRSASRSGRRDRRSRPPAPARRPRRPRASPASARSWACWAGCGRRRRDPGSSAGCARRVPSGLGTSTTNGPEVVGGGDQHLQALDGTGQGDRLDERDPRPERWRSPSGVPNVTSAAATAPGQEHDQPDRDERGGPQSSHASPAMRRAPMPFWPAPSRPSRDSAQPVP